jgi:hypothetical protein
MKMEQDFSAYSLWLLLAHASANDRRVSGEVFHNISTKNVQAKVYLHINKSVSQLSDDVSDHLHISECNNRSA